MTETLSPLVYPTRPSVPLTFLFQKSFEAGNVGFEVLWKLGRVGLKLPAWRDQGSEGFKQVKV